jgi:hypothetical protein
MFVLIVVAATAGTDGSNDQRRPCFLGQGGGHGPQGAHRQGNAARVDDWGAIATVFVGVALVALASPPPPPPPLRRCIGGGGDRRRHGRNPRRGRHGWARMCGMSRRHGWGRQCRQNNNTSKREQQAGKACKKQVIGGVQRGNLYHRKGKPKQPKSIGMIEEA